MELEEFKYYHANGKIYKIITKHKNGLVLSEKHYFANGNIKSFEAYDKNYFALGVTRYYNNNNTRLGLQARKGGSANGAHITFNY